MAEWTARRDKRNRLRMASALLKSEPGAVILCDEVEDVLSSGDGSRRENHGLVENASVPIVFTGNDLSKFDEAMLRRFDLTIHFKAHSPSRRRSVVRRMLENSGIESVTGEAVEPLVCRLADELECPPGIIERAIPFHPLDSGFARRPLPARRTTRADHLHAHPATPSREPGPGRASLGGVRPPRPGRRGLPAVVHGGSLCAPGPPPGGPWCFLPGLRPSRLRQDRVLPDGGYRNRSHALLRWPTGARTGVPPSGAATSQSQVRHRGTGRRAGSRHPVRRNRRLRVRRRQALAQRPGGETARCRCCSRRTRSAPCA